MNRKIIIYVTFCMLMMSCTHSSKKADINEPTINNIVANKDLYSIDIDNKSNLKKIYLSNIFKNVKTIILETTKDALIGSVKSIQIYEDYIFILDNNVAKGLFQFNKEGHFLKRFGNIGNGPGEYIEPTDFTLNIKDKILYILDSQTQKIIMYDLITGSYIKDVRIADGRYKSFNIQYAENRIFTDAYHYEKMGNEFLLQEINVLTGQSIKKWLPTKLYNKNFSKTYFAPENVFYDRTKKSPKFIQYFMDTIISIFPEKIVPLLTIKSDKLLKESDLQEIGLKNENIIMNLIQKDLVYHISDFISYKNILYFTYRHKNSFRCCFFNTNTKETQIGLCVIDDLIYKIDDENNSLVPRFCTSSEDGMYAYIDPIEIDRFVKLVKSNRLKVNLDKLDKLKQLTQGSNPVIFIYN